MEHVKPGDRVTRYHVDLCCPRCGAALTHTADAAATACHLSRAVATCGPCNRYFVISVTLVDATSDIERERRRHKGPDGNGNHGTYQCYRSGCRCDRCRRANADSHARYRAAERKGAA